MFHIGFHMYIICGEGFLGTINSIMNIFPGPKTTTEILGQLGEFGLFPHLRGGKARSPLKGYRDPKGKAPSSKHHIISLRGYICSFQGPRVSFFNMICFLLERNRQKKHTPKNKNDS